MHIVFCSSEVVPFAKTGGMADVCGTLPIALEKLGAQVTIMLPGYQGIDRKKFKFKKLSDGLSQTVVGKNIQVILIESEPLFGREGLYGDNSHDYPDNLKRFDFFNRRALEALKILKMQPDLIHCHDWQTALIPVYLKYPLQDDPYYRKMKTILSLHNLAYQGLFPSEQYHELPFTEKLFTANFEFYGKMNLLKAGIICSDMVSTVSPQYAKEIQTQQFGCGLEGVLKARGEDVVGVLNGLDYTYWDPQHDDMIPYRFSADQPENKKKNKTHLQALCGFPVKPEVPLFGFVNRLSHQKGMDLLKETMSDILKCDIQLCFLGVGEKKYEDMIRRWAKDFPTKVAFYCEFNESLAHQIYAGSDCFLMPSVYEPCGLSQMISLRYGTIPVVFHTGGLVDTVKSYKDQGNGFVFTSYDKEHFLAVIKAALKEFHHDSSFKKLMQRAFQSHFGWEDSAKQYLELYQQCLKK